MKSDAFTSQHSTMQSRKIAGVIKPTYVYESSSFANNTKERRNLSFNGLKDTIGHQTGEYYQMLTESSRFSKGDKHSDDKVFRMVNDQSKPGV